MHTQNTSLAKGTIVINVSNHWGLFEKKTKGFDSMEVPEKRPRDEPKKVTIEVFTEHLTLESIVRKSVVNNNSSFGQFMHAHQDELGLDLTNIRQGDYVFLTMPQETYEKIAEAFQKHLRKKLNEKVSL